jgi:ornithine cyclodeaminase
VIFLDRQAIAERHDPRALIEALAQAFTGDITAPPRGHHALGKTEEDGTLLVMPAWRNGGGIGVKMVAVLPRNSARGKPTVDGGYMLLGDDAEPSAILDAKYLTLIRTAAISALAASRMTGTTAGALLMVGAGALAPHLIRAHCAVRRFQRVLIWARRQEQAAALAEVLTMEGVPAVAIADLESAQGEAALISCATLATEPLVRGELLTPGAHVDLIGGFRPDMREADDDTVRRANIATDTRAALHEAGDLSQPVATGALDPARVLDLPALLSGASFAPGDYDISLFKSVGTAVADFATAEHLLSR